MNYKTFKAPIKGQRTQVILPRSAFYKKVLDDAFAALDTFNNVFELFDFVDLINAGYTPESYGRMRAMIIWRTVSGLWRVYRGGAW